MSASQPQWGPQKGHRRAEEDAFSVLEKEGRKEDGIRELYPQGRPLGAWEGALQGPGRGSMGAREGTLKVAPGSFEKSPKWIPKENWERAPKRTQGDPGRGKGKRRRNQIMGATKKATGGQEISPKGGPGGRGREKS
jgi:hypothetical protein